jgi:hypothetical protein
VAEVKEKVTPVWRTDYRAIFQEAFKHLEAVLENQDKSHVPKTAEVLKVSAQAKSFLRKYQEYK